MLPNAAQGHQDRQVKVSRRGFLFATTLAAAGASLPAGQRSLLAGEDGSAGPAGRPLFAYVGSYSSPQGPEGSKGHGRGIYLV